MAREVCLFTGRAAAASETRPESTQKHPRAAEGREEESGDKRDNIFSAAAHRLSWSQSSARWHGKKSVAAGEEENEKNHKVVERKKEEKREIKCFVCSQRIKAKKMLHLVVVVS